MTSNEEHAIIKYQDGKFTIEDEETKYGTGIMLKQAELKLDVPLAVQVGRTTLNFTLTDVDTD